MSYAGAAANVVGGELQGWANLLERNAMFDQYRDELARQGQYSQQGMDIFNTAVGQFGSDTANKTLTSSTANREQMYNQADAIPLSVTPTPYSGGIQGRRDEAFAEQRGQERASLGAYGDWALQRTLNDIQNKEALNQVVNFAKGTASVFPYRMYQAQHSMDDLAMIGAAISSIGGGAANYAQFAQGPQSSPGAIGSGSSFGNNSFYQFPQSSGYGSVPPNTAYSPSTDQSVYVPSAYSF